MVKPKNNQSGFTIIELLLSLIFLAIVIFIGVYVLHNNTNKLKNKNLTLTTSTTQANQLYSNYVKDVLDGQVLKDRNQWSSQNVNAAEDLQFINNHKQWFTQNFITTANNYEKTNTTPPGGAILVCENGLAVMHPPFQVTGIKQSGTTANLNLTYSIGGNEGEGPKVTFTLPMIWKANNSNDWELDSINMRDCSK